MKILLAIILPPVAVLLCGKPGQFILNILACCLFWITGIIHAVFVVIQSQNDKRHKEMIAAMGRTGLASHQGLRVGPGPS